MVEDNPHVLAFAEAVLTRQGYRTLLASSGEQALRISEAYEDPIHLVVTDVILPDINGRIVSERLKVQRPNIRVLFASGYSGDILSKSGVLEESIDLISKPFSALFLAQRVRDTLDRPL
ncbi:MAG TPA: response regulator [Holophaga sp.]|nr:response regulator [Holophaga sp.]